MKPTFGPWSSAIHTPTGLALSAFWRRRLGTLSSINLAERPISRRQLLALGAAGVTACGLPTLRGAGASGLERADDDRPDRLMVIMSQSKGRTGTGSVRVLDLESGKFHELCDDLVGGRIRIAPDGETIAHTSNAFVWIREPNGAKRQLLDLDPTGKHREQKVFSADGTQVRGTDTDIRAFVCWSPDGKQLVVSREEMTGKYQDCRYKTWLINHDGSDQRELPIPEHEYVYDWSPDGQWLAVVSQPYPPRQMNLQVYLVRLDGTERRHISPDGLNSIPRFSPDGRSILYLHYDVHAHESGGLWVVGVDGQNPRHVFHEPDTSIQEACWSPDGKRIALLVSLNQRVQRSNGQGGITYGGSGLHVIDLDSGGRSTFELPEDWHPRGIDWR